MDESDIITVFEELPKICPTCKGDGFIFESKNYKL